MKNITEINTNIPKKAWHQDWTWDMADLNNHNNPILKHKSGYIYQKTNNLKIDDVRPYQVVHPIYTELPVWAWGAAEKMGHLDYELEQQFINMINYRAIPMPFSPLTAREVAAGVGAHYSRTYQSPNMRTAVNFDTTYLEWSEIKRLTRMANAAIAMAINQRFSKPYVQADSLHAENYNQLGQKYQKEWLKKGGRHNRSTESNEGRSQTLYQALVRYLESLGFRPIHADTAEHGKNWLANIQASQNRDALKKAQK